MESNDSLPTLPRSMRLEPTKPLWLRIVFYAASVSAIVAGVLTVLIVVQIFLAKSVQMSLPVTTFWPQLRPSVHIDSGPTAEIVHGGFEQAEVGVIGLSTDVKVWLAVGHLLQGAVVVAILVTVALLCSRLLRNDPFRPALSLAITITAAVLTIGAIGWQLCYGIAGWRASIQVLNVTGYEIANGDSTGDPTNELGWPNPAGGVELNAWPLAVAIALLVVAAAFRYGEKIERERARLREQTQGLV